jgi:DNA-binding winged helix-turn-helix (wHTH) protein
MKNDIFQFGKWQVSPRTNAIWDGADRRALEPRAMDVLAALCAGAGAVLSAEQLLKQCWGNVGHGENPVHKAIAQLRRALGDNAVAPAYIETIRKRGYRTLAPVVRGGAGAGRDLQAPAFDESAALRSLVEHVEASPQISEQDRLAFLAVLERVARQARAPCGER